MSIVEPILSNERIQKMYHSKQWNDTTMLEYFDKAVAQHGDKAAVIGYLKETGRQQPISYKQLADLADRLAAGLLKKGIAKGDIVSFQLPNCWEFIVVYLACLRIGAVINPLMPIFRERELSFMLSFAESKLVFSPAVFRGFDHGEMINKLAEDISSLQHVCVIDNNGLEQFMVDQVSDQDRATFAANKVLPNEVFLIMYTSGTTGMPKGVMHTSNTHEYAARKFIERARLTADENILAGSPMAHMTGLMFGVSALFMLGTTSILLDQWDVDLAWQIIRDENIAFTMGATPFIADLTDSSYAESCNHDNFRVFLCGGAPVPPVIGRTASEKLKLNILTVWGMTEMSAVTSTLLGDSEEKLFESDGCPYAGTEVRILDQQGAELAAGQEGRLQTRGPANFVGYLKRPEAYETDELGWHETGDLAKIVHQKYIRITGRSKDIIIRGGENIPVASVENALYQHVAIQDTAIVAKPDQRLGEKACCFITFRDGKTASFEQIKTFLAEQGVSKNYWPEYIEVLSDMPRTASGKIQKFKLREMAQQLS
ncbi:MAG: AMP-binding protein [Cycloclasticus sp.]